MSKQFFFERKNQKTFASAVAPCGRVRDSADKSFFASFFSKKVGFAYFACGSCSRNTLGATSETSPRSMLPNWNGP